MNWFSRSSVVLVVCASVWAQQSHPVAELNGHTYTAAEVDRLLASLPPAEQQAAKFSVQDALKNYGFVQKLAREAEKEGSAKESPYRERIAYQRATLLAEAEMQSLREQAKVTPEEQRKFYDEHKDRFEQLRFKLLYVGFATPAKPQQRSEADAKKLIDSIHKKVSDGADFVSMVRQYSEAPGSRARDGEWSAPITRGTTISGAEDIVPLLFTLKPGKISEPVRQPNGYYLFRVEERRAQAYDEVKDQLGEALREAAANKQVEEIKKTVKLEVRNPAYFAPGHAAASSNESAGPDTVVAVLNGKNFTAAEIDELFNGLPPQLQQGALSDKKGALERFGLVFRLAELAEKNKLDQQSPYREGLAYGRDQVLSQAKLDTATHARIPTQEEQHKYYDENKDRYTQVKLRGVFVKSGDARSDQQAKALAAEIAKKARAGAKFDELVKQYSDDAASKEKGGEMGVIRKSDKIPEHLKTMLFGLKAGDITDPIEQPNGYFVFRVERNGLVPFAEANSDVYQELQQQGFQGYIEKVRKEVVLKELDPSYFESKKKMAASK